MATASKPQAPDDSQVTPQSLLSIVHAFVCELHPHLAQRPLSLDSSLERDLGIDSLARMELLVRIERRFGVSLPEQAIANAETSRDLLRPLLCADKKTATITELQVAEHSAIGSEHKPQEAQTLIEVLDWHVRAHPDRVHVQLYGEDDNPQPITYAELQRNAMRMAAGLQHAGLQPGQTVAIMLPTCAEYLYCFLGVLLAGGVPVPIYPPVRASQMEDHVRRHARILCNAMVTILITFPEVKAVAVLLKSQVESLHRVLTVADLSTGGALESVARLGGDDIAFLQYTSGSTGNPKGVVLTHSNIIANIRAMDRALETDSSDVFVSWLPLYHDMGLIGAWMGSLYVGFTLVLMSPLSFLSRPVRWLHAIHANRGTISGGPNFAFEVCLQRIEDEALEGLDLSSWRYVFDGAEPVSADTLRRFHDRFARYGLRADAIAPVYGLAEATLGLAFPPVGRGLHVDRIAREPMALDGRAVPVDAQAPGALEVVACGQPMAGFQVRVVDGAGHELPERMQGRLEFKGPSTTSGYYRNPEASRALFHDEWLDSGDLAYITGGDIYITSREKDIIIRAGRNIYPHELEDAIGDLDGIRKGCIAVFGCTDAQSRTERLVVVAETRETDHDLRADLQRKIMSLGVELIGLPPDEIVLARPRTVLKTSSGKIRRSATRELYEAGQLGADTGQVWLQFLRLARASLMPQLRRTRRVVLDTLFAGWAWGLTIVVGIACWVAVILAPKPQWRWSAMRLANRTVLRLTGTRLSVSGLDNIPGEGPFVLVSNHQSYLDGPLLVATVPRALSYVVKGELAAHFIFRAFLERIDVEFVERFDVQRGVEDSRRIAQLLESGRAIAYFPEGTFKRMPGLLPFHMGAFVSAADAKAPVVPITIRGTRSILRDQSWFPRHGAIRVMVGEPISPRTQEESSWDAAIRMRDAARAQMLRNCGEPDLVEHKIQIGKDQKEVE